MCLFAFIRGDIDVPSFICIKLHACTNTFIYNMYIMYMCVRINASAQLPLFTRTY